MADTATPTVAPGNTTTEHAMAHFVVLLSAAIAGLGTVASILSSITPIFGGVGSLGKWLALGGSVVAALTSFGYGLQRTLVKIAAINAGNAPPPDMSSAVLDVAAANLGKK